MSFLSKLIPRELKAIVPQAIAAIGTAYGGPLGGMIGGILGSTVGTSQASVPAAVAMGTMALPGVGAAYRAAPFVTGGAMSLMGRLTPYGVGTAVGVAASVGLRSARAIASSAIAYCKRHPGWCASIGGLAAVEAMVSNNQLPVIKRRRGRGLTPKDLRSFRRVASLIKGYCPTVRRVPTRKLGKRA